MAELSRLHKIPYFTLHASKIVVHPEWNEKRLPDEQHRNSLDNLKKPKYTGNLSPTKKSHIERILTSWLSSIKEYNKHQVLQPGKKRRYPIFVTLTLSAAQMHTDKEIKRLALDLFIKNVRNSHDVRAYFWRAETQKNGNIHFHLIFDCYIPHKWIRDTWNRIQAKLGYLDEFEKKYEHRNPNSTDVKGVDQVSDFLRYILKYCQKDENNRLIDSRIYGMSDNLRDLKLYQSELDQFLDNELSKALELGMITKHSDEYFTIFYFNKSFYSSRLHKYLENLSNPFYVHNYGVIYDD